MNEKAKNKKRNAVRGVIDSIVFQHPGFKRTLSRIENCHASFGTAGEPECVLVTGETGVGKSTLVKYYLSKNPPKQEPERRFVPVLSGVIPIPATMKNMATELLDSMGDPFADRGTLEQRTRRLRTLIRECGTELLVLDEFQHFIEKRSNRVILDVSDWLKNLITQTQVPVVLVGLPKSINVLEANEQLQRRFSGDIKIKAFDWEIKRDTEALDRLLDIVDQQVENILGERSNLTSFTEQIVKSSKGHIALIMKLLSHAGQNAAVSGSRKVEGRHLMEAYADKIRKTPLALNPFSDAWKGDVEDPFAKRGF